ncbi:hypothetical protein TWF102_009979 [Orbilia oligospora]|uniref:C2H2-type domain-containing protein n=1 Tax=Orbilia oligospora TaxID=2813651 RepID=A0A7C8K630_ORBOL|nr:hypothetical protein TWF103_006746 [Orbilia oligospora]KAF3109207.1 hypothetical protein TWF102_009979 [Orbilia oligospora]KAF3141331.1 hypothetical protein TWF703_002128 [Orbilia oligospora]
MALVVNMDQGFPLPFIFNNHIGVKQSIDPTISLTQTPTFSSFTSFDDVDVCWGEVEVEVEVEAEVGAFPSDINYDASGAFLYAFDNLAPIPVKYPECSSAVLKEVDSKQPTPPLLQPAPNDGKALITDNGPLSQGPDLSSSSPSIQDPPCNETNPPSIIQDKDPTSHEVSALNSLVLSPPRKLPHESKAREYNCKEYSEVDCPKKFTNRRKLEDHMRDDHNKRAYECPNAGCEHQSARYDNLKLHLRNCNPGLRSSHPPEASLQIAQKLKIGNGKRPRAFSVSSDVSTGSQSSKRKRKRISGTAKEISSVASTMASTPVSLQRQSGSSSPSFYPSPQETLANEVNEPVSSPSYPNKKINLLGQSIGAEHQVPENTSFKARGGTAEDIATLHQIIRVLKENEDRHKQEISGLMDELKDTKYKLKTWKNKALKQNRKCSCAK